VETIGNGFTGRVPSVETEVGINRVFTTLYGLRK